MMLARCARHPQNGERDRFRGGWFHLLLQTRRVSGLGECGNGLGNDLIAWRGF
jgi:hypothetical protein